MRCRHPKIVAGACRAYGVLIWLHPPALRREFGREMILTFRNRAEDIVNAGSVVVLLAFAAHIAIDWLRTFTIESDEPETLSLLGLGAGEEQAAGSIDRSSLSVSLFLATLGVALLIGGWYGWLSMNAEILRHHHIY